MKVTKNIIFILFFTASLFANTSISINESSSNSIIITLETSNINEKILTENGTNYHFLGIDNYGYLTEIGSPQLPFRSITLMTSCDPKIKIDVLESDIEIQKNVNIYPVQEPCWAVTGKIQKINFTKNEKIYQKNSFYPIDPIFVQGIQTYRGIPITQLGICPLQFNPVLNELKIYKKLKVKITYSTDDLNRGNISKIVDNTLLNNVISNSKKINKIIRSDINDNNDDILIITIPEFKTAAETLAIWHKMKGYDVKIDTKASWTTDEVKQRSHSFYNNTNPKPGYLVIIGDHEHVPAQEINKTIGNEQLSFFTDNYYVCTGDSNDYMPEFSRGRISVENANQAMIVIKKIIEYEKNPPTNSSFYKNTLGCAYFQDYVGGNDGYADRGFAQVIERINTYLSDDQGIISQRIYNTPSYIKPMYWNNTLFSWGEAIPDHLKKPGFAWDGNIEDIAKGINDGAFLVYHYDHGNHSGWGDPLFGIPHIDQHLTNGNKLPVIFSIDCLVGEFDKERYDLAAFFKVFKECFAEEIIRKENGGAAGIVAASTLSYSGWNDAFLQGMIDAIWPSDKMILKSPHMINPTVSPHEPIYTMGDILSQGLFRMTEMWSLYDLAQFHYEMYHYFGDPTMAIWTKEPKTITINNISDINITATSSECYITGINTQIGNTTLYNQNSNKIIGKSSFQNGSTLISLNNNGNVGDTIILTITSHNFKPFIKKLTISTNTSVGKEIPKANNSLLIKGKSIIIQKEFSQKAVISIFNIKGKLIKRQTVNPGKSNYIINLQKEFLANGTYFISLRVNNRTINQTLNLIK